MHILTVGSVASIVAVACSACGGPEPVTMTPEQVATKITEMLESQAGQLPGAATCERPLVLKNGETTHCTYVVQQKRGKPAKQVGMTVSYVSGDSMQNAQVQIEPDGAPAT
ncbi:MAG TPA: DUF4333 domain-containing protein [Pseudonocardia sp.]|nr:DUF4333 domain-containing protein [Pseudonocardia sp.]HTF47879.1 DUF4333 domain-containing protein [Pseudonocardia sp.]